MNEERDLHPLVKYITDRFNEARIVKKPIEDRMIRNLYVIRCEYTPEKLKEIRELGGSEIYLPLGNIKSRALKAWLTDIFFGSDEPPFDVEPTPVPELTSDIEEEIKQSVASELGNTLNNLLSLIQASGGVIDLKDIIPKFREEIERRKRQIQDKIYEYAMNVARREKKKIYDQFVEGGFFDALDECLYDLAIFPTVIMKSCIPRRVKVFTKDRLIDEKVIPTYNRVSPFDIYPSPSVPDFSDWVIEILHLTPYDLSKMKYISGYSESAIDTILGLYGETGYRIFDGSRSERYKLESKSETYYSLIDVIEFWGPIKGSLLADLDIDFEIEIEDNEYYEMAIWVCDDIVLRASINPDPLGNKPYHKASFIEIPDSFWGLSLIDVLYELQVGVNALARAIINNAALSSGPMIERNIDRIPAEEEKIILPWRIFDSTGIGFDSSPAYRFYQPTLTANALVQVIMYYMKLADELSGVPAYAHGDVTVGGGGRTASGLSMLMAQAARGIKEVVKNIDRGIIEPAVRRTYYYNVIDFYGYGEEIPDLNIRAKGSIVLMEKITQAQRMLELLQIVNNPIDLQIIGIEGRKYLLEKIFKNFGVEMPMNAELNEMLQALQQQLAEGALPVKKGKQAKRKEEPEGVEEQAQDMRKQMLGE